MKLFHARSSRSARVRWMLEELGLAYELERTGLGEEKSAEHKRHHPHGGVPALALDGRDGAFDGESMIESAAMLFHFGDLHADKGFTPAIGTPARARYYEAVVYAVATIDPQIAAIFRHAFKLPENERDPKLLAAARATLAIALAHIERGLGDKPYLLGDTFTLADVGVGWDLAVVGMMQLLGDHPRLVAYLDRLRARPAFGRAFAD